MLISKRGEKLLKERRQHKERKWWPHIAAKNPAFGKKLPCKGEKTHLYEIIFAAQSLLILLTSI